MSEGAWPLTVVARETGYMVSTAAASVQRMQLRSYCESG